MKNLLTIEVEEYFHDEGFAETADRRDWAKRESRVRRQTERLFELLDAKRARATFFVLGWVAEREPDLVREIAARGHEVASHGSLHSMTDTLTERAFRSDVRRGKQVLEDILGAEVCGYRAPGFSINQRTPWAHRVLAEEGFVYSSSVCPSRLDGDAAFRAPTTPWRSDCGGGRGIHEFPPLTRRLAGQNVPVAGGSYLRLLPVRVVSGAIDAMNQARAPAVLCLKPWEIDATQAQLPETTLSRWRHWAGVEEFEGKLSQLLDQHEFGTIGGHVGAEPQRDDSSSRVVA
jgi:polysaccharide deacetylase family protein (PEP-CTERM system associated)